MSKKDDNRRYFYYTVDQIKGSNLLTPERMAEVEAAIEARMLPVFGPDGVRIQNGCVVNKPDGRFLQLRMDHEDRPWQYLKRELMREALTDAEMDLIHDRWSIEQHKAFEARHFEKAEKITEWDGPVYREGYGFGEGYAESIEDFLDDIDPAEQPDYVWPCDVDPVVQLDLDSILEHAAQDPPEDWDSSDLDGLTELGAAIAVFNELNKGRCAWTPNYKKVLILKPATP